MTKEFEFIRLVGNERRVGDTLASVSRHWQSNKECFVFVSPHDDDVALGGGLFIQLAVRENIPVHVWVVTDGSMGYCSDEEKDNIAQIRKQEAIDSYTSLGVDEENLVFFDFPDCQLESYVGRHPSSDDSHSIAGHTGLQNAFTYYLRKVRPTQCFVPTISDLHPDHKITNEELQISLFHAGGNIWPELGPALEKVPYVHEMAVYCDFPLPPTLRVCTPVEYLEKKLDALAAFKSQKQIDELIEIVRKSGPQEYIRSIDFNLYQPQAYYDMFEKKHRMPFIR